MGKMSTSIYIYQNRNATHCVVVVPGCVAVVGPLLSQSAKRRHPTTCVISVTGLSLVQL